MPASIGTPFPPRTASCPSLGRLVALDAPERRKSTLTPIFSTNRQNRGVGRALMEALFARLGADGYRRGMLWVLAMNPSRFFYEAMGGKRLGTLGERVAGAEVEEWAYGWERLELR